MANSNPLSLIGQSALVTGASSGIGTGAALALAAAARGRNYRSGRDGAEAIAGRIREAVAKRSCWMGGLADEGQALRIFDEFVRAFGRIDILMRMPVSSATLRPL